MSFFGISDNNGTFIVLFWVSFIEALKIQGNPFSFSFGMKVCLVFPERTVQKGRRRFKLWPHNALTQLPSSSVYKTWPEGNHRREKLNGSVTIHTYMETSGGPNFESLAMSNRDEKYTRQSLFLLRQVLFLCTVKFKKSFWILHIRIGSSALGTVGDCVWEEWIFLQLLTLFALMTVEFILSVIRRERKKTNLVPFGMVLEWPLSTFST